MKNGKARPYSAQQIAAQAAAVEVAVQRAVRQALIEHKQSGDPVVICEGDQVRWIPAEEIEIPELPDHS
ncbi:MAG TPA: hypothetical protein VGJ26_09600 [Pirellulales bacterium]|jgi:hypothetical protein